MKKTKLATLTMSAFLTIVKVVSGRIVNTPKGSEKSRGTFPPHHDCSHFVVQGVQLIVSEVKVVVLSYCPHI